MYQKRDNFTRVGVVIANVLLIVLALELYANQNATIVLGTDNRTTVVSTETSIYSSTNTITISNITTVSQTVIITSTQDPTIFSENNISLPSTGAVLVKRTFIITGSFSHFTLYYTVHTPAQTPANINVNYWIDAVIPNGSSPTLEGKIFGQGTTDITSGVAIGTYSIRFLADQPDTYLDLQIVGG